MSSNYPEPLVLALDHGTSGCKVALVNMKGKVIDFANKEVKTYNLPGGGSEQDPDEWWGAFIGAAKQVISRNPGVAGIIKAIAVSSTWASTVAVDKNGKALMNALTSLDSRGARHIPAVVGGFPSIQGYSIAKLLNWVNLTGGIPTLSGKDDIAHVLVIKKEFPDIYDKTYKFLGSKDYFNLRLTGEFAASYDSITLFWVTDNRNISKIQYDEGLLKQLQVERDKLPELYRSVDILGTLTALAAKELGLPGSVQVVLGSPDLQCALLGAGSVKDYEGHCYIGTGSWIQCLVPNKKNDVLHEITALPSSIPGRYQCVNAQDIAGGCLSHLINNIIYPGIAITGGRKAEDPLAIANSMAAVSPPGANKLIYTPWLNGERTPISNPYMRGGIHNLSLAHNLNDIIRSIFEGVAYNSRWCLEYVEKFTGRNFAELALIGGGGESSLLSQILADVMDRPIKQMDNAIQANARGAGFIAAVGLGEITFNQIPDLVQVKKYYEPERNNREIYDQLYGEFKNIYYRNKEINKRLNK